MLSSNGGLRLSGLTVTGASAPDNVGNSFITSSTRGGAGNHIVELLNMAFEDFVINRAFSIVTAAKGTFFDRVEVSDSVFKNISGVPFKFDAETDDFGIYNVEYLIIENSEFSDLRSSVASIYRGGRDESTFGPHGWISGSSFTNIGNEDTPLAVLHGAQNVKIENNRMQGANPVRHVITTGIPKVVNAGNLDADGQLMSGLITEDMRK
jgi:poly(beta-D-mannuronate) lyase